MNRHFATRSEILAIFRELRRPGDDFTLSVASEANRARARARAETLSVEKERKRKRELAQRKRTEEKTWREPKGVTFNGVTLTLAAWARRLGVSDSTLRHRKMLGWSLEKMLTTP